MRKIDPVRAIPYVATWIEESLVMTKKNPQFSTDLTPKAVVSLRLAGAGRF